MKRQHGFRDGKVNLFADSLPSLPDEVVTVLATTPTIRVERIVSTGHVTPPGQWYDQQEDEFVVLLKGEAVLRFTDSEPLQMTPGSWILIPAHRRHRVERTSLDEPTVWLAIFSRPGPCE
jgi:cupin 2 domain-containing protein